MNEKRVTLEDRKRMTFSQAEGIEELPAQLKWGELDDSLRLLLWDVLYGLLKDQTGHGTFGPYFRDEFYKAIRAVIRVHENLPLDEAEDIALDVQTTTTKLKKVVLKGAPNAFRAFERIFGSARSPYQLVNDPPTFVPKGLPEAGNAASRDLTTIKDSGLMGARSHLLASAEALNHGDARGAVREAIHAVESAAKQITGENKATLPDALKLLEKEKGLHPALREALSRMYGYTRDEEGIRHALLESDNKDVGIDEALFMFSACAAFVSFLARKFPDKDVAE